MTLDKLCKNLEKKIQTAYEQGTSLEEAEKLAGEFLYAMLQVSTQLQVLDLDSRMKKTGLKAIRATVLLDEIRKADKKPSDTVLVALVDSNETVIAQQDLLDTAEVEHDRIERYYNIFLNAHIFFRGVSKGRFE